jgi:hypothetical protein
MAIAPMHIGAIRRFKEREASAALVTGAKQQTFIDIPGQDSRADAL